MQKQEKTVVPKFVFTSKELTSVVEADKTFGAFLEAIKNNDVIEINLVDVETISADFADRFFGAAAAECIVNNVRMEFKFTTGKGAEMMAVIQEAIGRALPPSLGGVGTVH